MNRIIFTLILLTGLACPTFAQSVTTTCKVSGDTAVCTSTPSQSHADYVRQEQADNWAAFQRGAQAGQQWRAEYERKKAFDRQKKAYCSQHKGESWTYRSPDGTVLDSGVCQ